MILVLVPYSLYHPLHPSYHSHCYPPSWCILLISQRNLRADLGVLLGEKGGSSSDNVGWIIAVAIAIPVAVVIVLGAVVIGSIVAYRRRKARRAHFTVKFKAVNEQL